jgi:glutamine amidotransferase
MCEIFGGSFRDEYYLNDYLNVFYSHSDNHPHGWGLACFEGKDAFIEKEPVQATKSKYLKAD